MKINHNALRCFQPAVAPGIRAEAQLPAAARSRTGVWAAVSAQVRSNPGMARLGTFESRYPNLSSLGRALNSQDRMGNFEIQRLMSAFNQAETLLSNVLKKTNDTANSVIGKI